MEDDPLETVRRTAQLARLEISQEEADRLAPQFARILEAFRSLESLPDSALGPGSPRETALSAPRADEPRPPLGAEEVLRPAPERVEDYFSVPKTLPTPGTEPGSPGR